MYQNNLQKFTYKIQKIDSKILCNRDFQVLKKSEMEQIKKK